MSAIEVANAMAFSYALQILRLMDDIRGELLIGEVADMIERHGSDQQIETLRAVTP